jgi:hypothetical protein
VCVCECVRCKKWNNFERKLKFQKKPSTSSHAIHVPFDHESVFLNAGRHSFIISIPSTLAPTAAAAAPVRYVAIILSDLESRTLQRGRESRERGGRFFFLGKLNLQHFNCRERDGICTFRTRREAERRDESEAKVENQFLRIFVVLNSNARSRPLDAHGFGCIDDSVSLSRCTVSNKITDPLVARDVSGMKKSYNRIMAHMHVCMIHTAHRISYTSIAFNSTRLPEQLSN